MGVFVWKELDNRKTSERDSKMQLTVTASAVSVDEITTKRAKNTYLMTIWWLKRSSGKNKDGEGKKHRKFDQNEDGKCFTFRRTIILKWSGLLEDF